ncbi:hypothetical protein ERJ75_001745200 [Trypanosoma vivax]|uniref:Uncharacterized protein n=1 Tax=Trypanosoma vivax (strain Y486) TaxID=1055687 RepID=G0U2Q5_TRYVY|nr:hypothetical protein TRVL_05655 [Trypanosoma vivax]KAH8604134.1 hypothetical protein ERJ75_001745200 [Trypanosoma vivax]CCC50559.1 conserved hypothetical protein [Trypanosoma vivax Y486]
MTTSNEWHLPPLHSGDVVFMERRCTGMRHPLGIGICLLNKLECPYDHVAMVLKLTQEEVAREREKGLLDANEQLSPSDTYVVETNLNGCTVRSLENRLGRSTSKSISVRQLHGEGIGAGFDARWLRHLEIVMGCPYKTNLNGFIPLVVSPPDKMDRVKAAHKLYLLERETRNIEMLLNTRLSTEDAATLHKLKRIYADAAVLLVDIYFPHLGRADGKTFPSVDYSGNNFRVDGSNTETSLCCSELIAQMWQRSGILAEFPPASSFRPFDFLNDTRLNFLSPSISLGELQVLRGGNVVAPGTQCTTTGDSPAVARCFDFYRALSGGACPEHGGLDSMHRWLMQSSTNQEVRHGLVFNVVSTGALFALCGLLSAPLRLRWMECQLGVVLRRGSVWSLSAGCFARDVLFSVAQGLVCLSLLLLTRHETKYTFLGAPLMKTNLFDTRHPYYHVCTAWLVANMVAHLLTTPMLNAVIAHHFGPATPGPWPLRMLTKGSLSLLPLAMVLPYQAAWVSCFETFCAAIVPTPSSVFRRRPDLLETDEWRRYRSTALVSAFASTAVIDLVMYPMQRQCWRSLLATMYHPAPSPSYGRRLYAGYGFRFLGNMVTMFTTCLTFSVLGIV